MVQAHGSKTTRNMLKNASELGLHRARQVFDGGPHRGHADAMLAAAAPRAVDALRPTADEEGHQHALPIPLSTPCSLPLAL